MTGKISRRAAKRMPASQKSPRRRRRSSGTLTYEQWKEQQPTERSMIAQLPGPCAWCPNPIEPGQSITWRSPGWQHVECLAARDAQERPIP